MYICSVCVYVYPCAYIQFMYIYIGICIYIYIGISSEIYCQPKRMTSATMYLFPTSKSLPTPGDLSAVSFFPKAAGAWLKASGNLGEAVEFSAPVMGRTEVS